MLHFTQHYLEICDNFGLRATTVFKSRKKRKLILINNSYIYYVKCKYSKYTLIHPSIVYLTNINDHNYIRTVLV